MSDPSSSSASSSSSSSSTSSALPQILTRSILPTLMADLDAGDVIECYALTRKAPLHFELIPQSNSEDDESTRQRWMEETTTTAAAATTTTTMTGTNPLDSPEDKDDTTNNHTNNNPQTPTQQESHDTKTTTTTTTPNQPEKLIMVQKNAIGLRYSPPPNSNKPKMELTLEYGPQRLGALQKESMPLVHISHQDSFVTWENEGKIYYTTTLEQKSFGSSSTMKTTTMNADNNGTSSTSHTGTGSSDTTNTFHNNNNNNNNNMMDDTNVVVWDSAYYMTSVTGTVLHQILDWAIEYPSDHPRYQPFHVILENGKTKLKSSSSHDFLSSIWTHMANVGVVLRPILPPPEYVVRFHTSSITKVTSQSYVQDLVLEQQNDRTPPLPPTTNTAGIPSQQQQQQQQQMTVAEEATLFFQKMYNCASAIATGNYQQYESPTPAPITASPSLVPSSSPTQQQQQQQQQDDDDDNDTQNGEGTMDNESVVDDDVENVEDENDEKNTIVSNDDEDNTNDVVDNENDELNDDNQDETMDQEDYYEDDTNDVLDNDNEEDIDQENNEEEDNEEEEEETETEATNSEENDDEEDETFEDTENNQIIEEDDVADDENGLTRRQQQKGQRQRREKKKTLLDSNISNKNQYRHADEDFDIMPQVDPTNSMDENEEESNKNENDIIVYDDEDGNESDITPSSVPSKSTSSTTKTKVKTTKASPSISPTIRNTNDEYHDRNPSASPSTSSPISSPASTSGGTKDEAAAATQAANEAKEAAAQAKEAAHTDAENKAATAAEAAANAAQKAADATSNAKAKHSMDKLKSGDGELVTQVLRACFEDPKFGIMVQPPPFEVVISGKGENEGKGRDGGDEDVDNGNNREIDETSNENEDEETNNSTTSTTTTTTLIQPPPSRIAYLYLDGTNYYRLNLTYPYMDVALINHPLPTVPPAPASTGGDMIDWMLAILVICLLVLGILATLQQMGMKILFPHLQHWFFSPTHTDYEDAKKQDDEIRHKNKGATKGQGYAHSFGQDVIPFSMGGRRPQDMNGNTILSAGGRIHHHSRHHRPYTDTPLSNDNINNGLGRGVDTDQDDHNGDMIHHHDTELGDLEMVVSPPVSTKIKKKTSKSKQKQRKGSAILLPQESSSLNDGDSSGQNGGVGCASSLSSSNGGGSNSQHQLAVDVMDQLDRIKGGLEDDFVVEGLDGGNVVADGNGVGRSSVTSSIMKSPPQRNNSAPPDILGQPIIPPRLARDPDLVDLPHLKSSSKVATPAGGPGGGGSGSNSASRSRSNSGSSKDSTSAAVFTVI